MPERAKLSASYHDYNYNPPHNHHYNLSYNYHYRLSHYNYDHLSSHYHDNYKRDLRHQYDLFLLPDGQLLSFWLQLSHNFLLSQQLELCSCP